MQELLDDKGMGIKFEYTAVDTPQQNGKVERKFATLYGKVRSALNAAKLKPFLRFGLWAECAKMITKQENILVTGQNQESPYEQFYSTVKKPSIPGT